MKLVSYEITPNKIQFELHAENEAEVALLAFCDNQSLTVNVDEDSVDHLVLSGAMAR